MWGPALTGLLEIRSWYATSRSCTLLVLHLFFQKNVYMVFRSTPASVGFAQLSTMAGGSGAEFSGSVSGSYIYSCLLSLQEWLLQALVILLSLVCVPFSVGQYYFSYVSSSGAMSTTIPAFLMLSTSFIAGAYLSPFIHEPFFLFYITFAPQF